MESEVSELIGAARGQRTEDRATHRNGYRPRRWDTRAEEIDLQSSVKARISRALCSPVSGPSRRWSRWSSRPPSAASRRGVWISSHAVHETGRREIIGLDIGEADVEA